MGIRPQKKRLFKLLPVAFWIISISAVYADTIVYPGQTPGNPGVPSVPNSIYPGVPSNNTVTINGGGPTIAGSVFGGIGQTSGITSTDNVVTMNDGRVTNNVTGGWSLNSNSENNQLNLNNGRVDNIVYGGWVDGGTGAGNNNLVSVGSGMTLGGNIYGAYVQGTGGAQGNNVIINGGTMLSGTAIIAGAYGLSSGTIQDNTVTISGGTMNNASVYGGRANVSSNIINNTLNIQNGTVGGSVFGGQLINGNNLVSGNKLMISGGSIAGDAFGGAIGNGAGSTGNVVNNEVTISGGTIQGSIYGGKASTQANAGNATGNMITISNTPIFAATTSIYGGTSGNVNADAFTGNTLNFSAHPVTVDAVSNFQNYHFTIDPAHANDPSTALINANSISLGNGAGMPSDIKVVGIHSGNLLNADDTFILMNAASMTGNGVGLTTTGLAQQGISLLYDVRTDVDIPGNKVTATILGANSDGSGGNGGNAAHVNPQLKALSEGYLAGAQLVMRGADLIADDTFKAIDLQNNRKGWVPFAVVSAQHNRYDSGSHIKSNDFLLTGGLSYQQDKFSAGAFLEGGWGSYDSYNSFYDAADVKGDGNDHYYGMGFLGRYELDNGIYAEGSVRLGRNHNKFDTKDIQSVTTGEYARYTAKSSYVSTHLGVGYIMPLNDRNELDLSARYLYSTVGGEDLNIAGDPIHFDRINSHRARVNAKLNFRYSNSLTLNAGLGYEHEFDGKANATTYTTYSIAAPNVRGGTGIVSIGANIRPISNQRLSLDMIANGYMGKREGAGASVRMNYAF